MAPADLPPLRYLTADDVRAAMPPLDERLALAEKTMVALLDEDTELPPKVALHLYGPAFGHAMPARMIDQADGQSRYLSGMKWIAGSRLNRAKGIAALHGYVLLVDGVTGATTAILDAGPITAERTAAVSGVAVRAFAPALAGRGRRVAILGAGVQGHSHLAPIGFLLPGAELKVFDRHPDRAAALARRALDSPGIASAQVASSARSAIADVDVAITAVSFDTRRDIRITSEWLATDALVVAVDYSMCVTAEVAANAALFVVDHAAQFRATREAGGHFAGYPDPAMELGQALVQSVERPPGRVVVTHLGVGLADLVFADAIVRRAEAAGIGLELPR